MPPGVAQRMHNWECCGNPDGKAAIVLHGDPVQAAHRASVDSSIQVLTAYYCSTSEDAGAVGHWPIWI